MKFQAGTFSRANWLTAGILVIAAGEAAMHASTPWLAVLAVAAFVLAVVVRRHQGSNEPGLTWGLGLLALASAIAAARMAHTVYHADKLQTEAIAAATADRNEVLRSSLAAAVRGAAQALERVNSSKPGSIPSVNDIRSGIALESAIAVLGGDTVIAAAGPHRIPPLIRPAPVGMVTTPFARVLVVRTALAHRQGQVVLLLDSLPGLPVAGPSLASSAGGWEGVRWTWDASIGRDVEFPSARAAEVGVLAAMRAIAPAKETFIAREAQVARVLVAAGLGVLALLVLFTASSLAARLGAILLPLWSLARSGVAAGMIAPRAVETVLVAVALLFAGVLLWRTPARRTVIGVAAGALMLLLVVPAIVFAARFVIPHDAALSLAGAFAWQLVLAVSAAGLFLIAMAPLRTAAPGERTSLACIAALILAMALGLIGVEAWSPNHWASWYWPLWLLPLLLMVPPCTLRMRLVTLATTAGVIASLATWSTSLDRRIELASADLARLNAPSDVDATVALHDLAASARAAHATTLDRLYAAWLASGLARQGVPSFLSLWSAGGQQRAFVALDSLSVGYSDLKPLVREVGDSARYFDLPRRVGHHQVLVLPLAADTVATITIGPRSHLLATTNFGQIVAWRQLPDDPAYSVEVPLDPGPLPDGAFHRSGRYVTAEEALTASDPVRIVRATIEMSTPSPFIVRAALTVLLQVGVVLGAWLLLQLLLGQGTALPSGIFRRSYRRTLSTLLMAFFIVPAVVFTLSSLARVRDTAAQQRADEVATALRNVIYYGGLTFAADAHPSADSLGVVSDSANAEVAVYRRGHLIAAGDSLLAELGLLPPVFDSSASTKLGPQVTTLTPPLPHAGFRLGVLAALPPGTELVAAVPGGETGLAREQIDQVLRLLLLVLSGVIASVLVAGAVARALGEPIEMLRRTAVAIGRHEPSPAVSDDLPAEFVPVFGAIGQMERDLRNTEGELRAGRERTAAILSTVATGVIGVDAHGIVMHANPRASDLLGADVVVGASIATVLPDAWVRESDAIARMLRSDVRTLENHELQVDDQRFAVTLAPLADGGVVLAITDITEASRAARILAWGEMARQVAHEIKNPLTPMRLGLQHLRRVGADAAPGFPKLVDETAVRLLAEIERLDRIARSFARYGAPPEGHAPLEAVDLRAVSDQAASLFALGSQPMPVTVVGATASPVQARQEEVTQLLVNLLDNARQAGATAATLELAGTTLRVADNGRGIPNEQLGRIFEPSFSTNTSGTGLGLAIVKRLVEGWGAQISVESESGSGAVFVIDFVTAVNLA